MTDQLPINFPSCDGNRKRLLQAALQKKKQRKTKRLEEEENEEMSVSGAAALETGLDAAAVRADLS